MKKTKILFLFSFRDLNTVPSSYGKILHDLNREFKEFYIVNTDRLEIIFKGNAPKFKKSNFFKNLKLFDPKSLSHFDEFIKNKDCLIINGVSRRLRYFALFYFIARKKIPQIMITHLGHIQPSPYYYQGKIGHRINNLFIRTIPHLLHNLFVMIKLFSQIDIRFISNAKLYNDINSSSFKKKFSYVKSFKLVNSLHYEEKINIKKPKQKHILLLELPPNYEDVSEITGKFKEQDLKVHYKNLNNFLLKLRNSFKKKIIISISPKYSFKKAKFRFKKFKIVNRNVQKYIHEAFLVVFYDSSTILYAIMNKKPIINLKSNLFEKINYKTDHYNKYLKLKEINISEEFKFSKTKLMKDLRSRFKYYNYFLKKYLPKNKNSGNEQIIDIIKKEYF
ncbi:hypothetical protein IDH32_00515 [Pelagibacterales bacterium SAG-MED01]|nr:hypothetical protein [Pelagibacterales bacterium SAG-MED01]